MVENWVVLVIAVLCFGLGFLIGRLTNNKKDVMSAYTDSICFGQPLARDNVCSIADAFHSVQLNTQSQIDTAVEFCVSRNAVPSTKTFSLGLDATSTLDQRIERLKQQFPEIYSQLRQWFENENCKIEASPIEGVYAAVLQDFSCEIQVGYGNITPPPDALESTFGPVNAQSVNMVNICRH